MKVYEAMAKAFAAEGTTAVFGLMGDANMHWIDALEKIGVRVYEVRHEGAGFSMADGWARVSGQTGVCTTTSGPGTSQIATASLVASRGGTPMVTFCGDTKLGDHAALQRLDQKRFAAATEAGFVRVDTADGAYEGVRQAFYLAKLESRPIMLSIGEDIQLEEFDDGEEYRPSKVLFPAVLPTAGADTLERAAEIIAGSERPVIVVGRGAQDSGAAEAVLRLAERTGALITTSLLAMNWLSDRDEYHAGVSGLYATRTAIELFQTADCVVAVGASLNLYTTEHGYLYPDATIVQIDVRPSVVMGDGRLADCFVHSDARRAVEAIDSLLEARSASNTGFRTADVKARLAAAHDDPGTFELAPGTVDPRDVCLALDSVLTPDVGVVLGSCHATNFAIMHLTRERVFIQARKDFGCIGQGLPTSLGAVIASGRTPTCCIEGDASFMMHLAEFETAVRYQLPLLVVVLNDEMLGSEFHKAGPFGLDVELSRITTPDLGAVGTALGGRGILARTIDDVRRGAESFVADPGPMIIDARVSPNVLAIPYRRLRGEEAV